MCQAALLAAARLTHHSHSLRQCFSHPGLPARTRGLPPRQCLRRHPERSRCPRLARLWSSAGLQHLGSSSRRTESLRQCVTGLASACKCFLRPHRVFPIGLLGIRRAPHIGFTRDCRPGRPPALPTLLAAGVALDVLHRTVPISELEDFEISAVDPQTRSPVFESEQYLQDSGGSGSVERPAAWPGGQAACAGRGHRKAL
jgi:hypothetical protein